MTFIIFLASIAVLEYLLRDTGRKAGREEPPPDPQTATADLLALGQALSLKSAESAQITPELSRDPRSSAPP